MRCNLVRHHRAHRTAAVVRNSFFRLVSPQPLRQLTPDPFSTICNPASAICRLRPYSTRTCLYPELPLLDSSSATSSELPTIRAIALQPAEPAEPAEQLHSHLLIARFRQLEQSIQQWSTPQHAPDHWADCVRSLAEMKQIHHQLLDSPHHNDELPAEEETNIPPLTLVHFHQVFRALLLTCAAASPQGTSAYFPTNMLCKDWGGEMLSFCLGAETDAPAAFEDTPARSSPSIVRQSFRPDFAFYTRLMNRIERGPKARDHAHNLPSEHSASVTSNEGLWMLAMALEQCRASSAPLYDEEPIEPEEEEGEEDKEESTQLPDTVTPRMPSLAFVRHLFNGLLESDLRPTRQTINYMLAIFEQHIRTKHQLQGTQFDLEQFDTDAREQTSAATHPSTLASSTPPSIDVSEDMLYLWKLWNDMSKLYHVHPDLLSQVLMLRLCYQHQQFAYMSRLLVDINTTSRIVASTESMLSTHQFDEPHLLIDALTHSSKVSSRIESNERLEFLGDSVLDVLVRELVVCKMSSAYGIQLHKHDSTSVATGPQQVLLPQHFQSQELPPTQLLAQIKGKHVSHGILAKVSTQLGLSRILLEANRDVRNSLFGWVERNEMNKARSSSNESNSGKPSAAATGATLASSPTVPDISIQLATDSVIPSSKKPVSKREQAALKKQLQPVLTDNPSQAKSAPTTTFKGGVDVPASLAEDAFEALLAALFLDSPAEAANKMSVGASSQLQTPDRPMTATKQSYGISAARDFIMKTLGTPIIKDCYQAIDVFARRPTPGTESPARVGRPFYLSANGGMPSYSISKAEEQGYDARVNYKSLLEEYVRATHTDPATGICQAHILYVLLGQFGAHAFRVRVIIKNISNFIPSSSSAAAASAAAFVQHNNHNFQSDSVSGKHGVILPYVRYMHNQEMMRRGLPLESGKSSPYRFTSFFQPSSPISFSIPMSHLPYIDTKADREFPTAVEQPEPQSAEHAAAFFALRQLKRV